MKHPTYIINLEERVERKKHIFEIFKDKSEFDISVFNAIKKKSGAMGLFLSFREIIKMAKCNNYQYVIICEDDHLFTLNYDAQKLNSLIDFGLTNNFDMLLGGPSNIHDAVFLNSNLIWLSGFTGLQFSVVFSRFYEIILSHNFIETGSAFDIVLGTLSDEIYCCYPSISEQKYFGYSDATFGNNSTDVKIYFEKCSKKLDRLHKVSNYFRLINDR